MIKVYSITGCFKCKNIIDILLYNKIYFQEIKDYNELYKLLPLGNLPIIFKNNEFINTGKFLMELNIESEMI